MFLEPVQPALTTTLTLLLVGSRHLDANLNDISHTKERFGFKQNKISSSKAITRDLTANVSQRTRGITAVLSRPAALKRENTPFYR